MANKHAWYVDVNSYGLRSPEVRRIELFPSIMIDDCHVIMGSAAVEKGRDWFDTREEAVAEARRRIQLQAKKWRSWEREAAAW